MKIPNRLVLAATLLAGGCLGWWPVQAQDTPAPSVAEAARRTREQKKSVSKPSEVVTNDTLKPAAPSTPNAPVASTNNSALTEPVTPSSEMQASAPANPPAAPKGLTEDQLERQKAELEALKKQFAEKQGEVDLQQRELALANDDFYSHPDFSKDLAGKDKLDAMQADLAAKQKELAQLKAKLGPAASLEAEHPPTPKP